MRTLSEEYKADIDSRIEGHSDKDLLGLLVHGKELYERCTDDDKVVYAFNKLKAEIKKRGIME